MKSQPSENHPSYKIHRHQFWLQIFLPMLVTTLFIIAVATLTSLATFGENGDVSRWAAISTIWLVIPIMLFGLIFLAILVGLVYLLARGLKATPLYTAIAHYYVNQATDATKEFSDKATSPVLYISGITASIKTLFGKN